MKTTLTPERSGPNLPEPVLRREWLWPYFGLGIFLGIVFTRSEVISWFRIQEMFRFQAFHMFGIIGSAVAVGALGVWMIKRFNLTSLTGREPDISRVPFRGPGYRYWIGGSLFGVGWGLLGACPGPIYVLIGNGMTVMTVGLASAVLGAWAYGALRSYLPHR